jgi:hypothetical protein
MKIPTAQLESSKKYEVNAKVYYTVTDPLLYSELTQEERNNGYKRLLYDSEEETYELQDKDGNAIPKTSSGTNLKVATVTPISAGTIEITTDESTKEKDVFSFMNTLSDRTAIKVETKFNGWQFEYYAVPQVVLRLKYTYKVPEGSPVGTEAEVEYIDTNPVTLSKTNFIQDGQTEADAVMASGAEFKYDFPLSQLSPKLTNDVDEEWNALNPGKTESFAYKNGIT